MSRRRGSRLLPLPAVGAAGIVPAACGGGSSSFPAIFFTDPPPEDPRTVDAHAIAPMMLSIAVKQRSMSVASL